MARNRPTPRPSSVEALARHLVREHGCQRSETSGGFAIVAPDGSQVVWRAHRAHPGSDQTGVVRAGIRQVRTNGFPEFVAGW